MKLYIALTTCLLPFYIRFGSIGDVRFSQEFLFIFAGCAFLLLVEPPLRTKKTIQAGQIGALLALGYVYLGVEDPYLLRSFSRSLLVAIGIAVAYRAAESFRESIHYKFLLNCFALSCTIQSCWVVLGKIGFDPYHWMMPSNFQVLSAVEHKWQLGKVLGNVSPGSLLHPNLSGAHIAILLPSLIRGKWIYVLPISFLALYILGASLAVGTAVLSLSLLFVIPLDKKYRAPLLLSLGFALFGAFIWGLFFGGYFSNNNRLDVWVESIQLFFSQSFLDILFGVGLGQYPELYNAAYKHDAVYYHAHNEYIEILYASGVIGLSLFCWLAYKLVRIPSSIYVKAIFCSILFNMAANFTLHIASLSSVAILSLAALLNTSKEQELWHFRLLNHKSNYWVGLRFRFMSLISTLLPKAK